jgi:hypothetical protein
VDHLLDLGHAQRLLAAHRRGDGDHSRKIWTVLMFCLWYAQQRLADCYGLESASDIAAALGW